MRKLIIFLFLCSTGPFLTAQDNTPSFIKDSLDIYVERAMKDWQIPGVVVCVVKDGKVVVMKGYGVKEAGTTDKVDANTLFMIGSNSKAFTGTGNWNHWVAIVSFAPTAILCMV